jgi:hypothetical protein
MEADVVGPKIHELVRLAEADEVRSDDPVAPPHQVGYQSDPTVRPERLPEMEVRDNFGESLETLCRVTVVVGFFLGYRHHPMIEKTFPRSS